MDLWPVDIRRFARFHGNDRWLRERVRESLGLHYAMSWPNREFESARRLRRSPLYRHLAKRGASFGTKMGWESANWFAPEGVAPVLDYSWGRQKWFGQCSAGHRAVREAVAVRSAESRVGTVCVSTGSLRGGRYH